MTFANTVPTTLVAVSMHPILANTAPVVTEQSTVELQWLETFGTMKSRQGYFELMSVNNSARPGGILGLSFRFS